MTLFFQDRGPHDAEVIVFAGSLGTTRQMWKPQVDALSESYRTIAYDQLGHGRSPVPDGPYSIAQLGEAALDLFDHLELTSVSFVGLSIGGMVGQWLAANAPERIDRLVLLCTSAHLPPPEPWHDRARTVVEAGTTEAIADAVVARWLTPGFAAEHPERALGLRTMLVGQPPKGYAACCEAIAAMDQRALRISTPTLVIGGAQDLAIPNDHQRFLADNINNARLEILSPGAHVVSIERADDVNRLIREHLEAA
jgi:3-oxoadipate enol-lactonase